TTKRAFCQQRTDKNHISKTRFFLKFGNLSKNFKIRQTFFEKGIEKIFLFDIIELRFYQIGGKNE
ncbi:MAG: hypothetical protein IJ811_03190, partial [Clostridia bacterium]|nr:hypothetical protein [Clostridia bacterium]